jgi:hypothetical protein
LNRQNAKIARAQSFPVQDLAFGVFCVFGGLISGPAMASWRFDPLALLCRPYQT